MLAQLIEDSPYLTFVQVGTSTLIFRSTGSFWTWISKQKFIPSFPFYTSVKENERELLDSDYGHREKPHASE